MAALLPHFSSSSSSSSTACLIILFAFVLALPGFSTGTTHHYTFNVTMANVTRLCRTKNIPTVNGQYPGQKLVVREGDRLVVNVINNIKNNVTFHWHGVRQIRNGWADGPSHITQCPILTGQSYVYNFTIVGQTGTLWWHAHVSWLRVHLHGPIIIHPKRGVGYPFPKPYKEVPILFGEWFKLNTEAVIARALRTGGAPNVSDAYTFNGLPGPSYNCSAKDTFKLKVKPGKTYLLRLVNAALNDELYFAIANHTLTVVGTDANYVKPFTANTIFVATGQTTDVLLSTHPTTPSTSFLMAISPYTTTAGTYDNTTAFAILEYSTNPNPKKYMKPTLPAVNDTNFVANFSRKFRSLANAQYPARVPQSVDRHFFFTVGLGLDPCPKNKTCQGPNGTRFTATVNNVSFTTPKTALLQAHYFRKYQGVLTANFPEQPPFPFNYTGTPPNNTFASHGTRVVALPFNTSVQLVMQDTSIVGLESHPLHLHGYDFYVVAEGSGNYNPRKVKFNLVDPVGRNTVSVPSGGWVAVRFFADNPGVWFMHCHLDAHLSWGLNMAWMVNDGPLPSQKMLPPPPDLPKC